MDFGDRCKNNKVPEINKLFTILADFEFFGGKALGVDYHKSLLFKSESSLVSRTLSYIESTIWEVKTFYDKS